MADQVNENAEPEVADPPADDAGVSTLTKDEKKERVSDRKPGQLPPFKVLLHNDDVNTFDHVISTIVRVTPLTAEEAVLRTLEAHEQDLSLLLVTHQERAELYQEQFASALLQVTIEPD